MPRGTQVSTALFSVSGTRLSLALAGLSRPLPLPTPRSHMPTLQPRMNESMRFGLFPVRSPLLGESRLISFPSGTEMFHFPEFAPCNLCIQLQATGYDSRRVSPFRDPRIKGCSSPSDAKASTRCSCQLVFSKRISFLPYSIVREPPLARPSGRCLIRNKNLAFLLLSDTTCQ